MGARTIVISVAPVAHVGTALPPGVANPLTPEQVAAEVVGCARAGASMVHLHVRDLRGEQTFDLAQYTRTLDLIRRESDIVIQGSTGGMSTLTLEQRCVSLREPRTEVASLNMGSVNFGESVYVNTLPDIRFWAAEMRRHDVVPELEIFEGGMLASIARLVGEGVLEPPLNYNFSLGFHGALPADPRHLAHLAAMLPPGSHWSLIHEGMEDFRLAGRGARARGDRESRRRGRPPPRPGRGRQLERRAGEPAGRAGAPARSRDRHARRGTGPSRRAQGVNAVAGARPGRAHRERRPRAEGVPDPQGHDHRRGAHRGREARAGEAGGPAGVSRTPLLSAFSRLEQESLVRTVPRRGAFVRSYTREELVHIYDIRCRLEPLGARDAAVAASAADLAALRRHLADFDTAAAAGDTHALKRTDFDFHMELMRCSGNRFLYDMLATYNIIIIANTTGLLKPAEQSDREHHELMDALEARDPERADRIMFGHLSGARANLLQRVTPAGSQATED